MFIKVIYEQHFVNCFYKSTCMYPLFIKFFNKCAFMRSIKVLYTHYFVSV